MKNETLELQVTKDCQFTDDKKSQQKQEETKKFYVSPFVDTHVHLGNSLLFRQ